MTATEKTGFRISCLQSQLVVFESLEFTVLHWKRVVTCGVRSMRSPAEAASHRFSMQARARWPRPLYLLAVGRLIADCVYVSRLVSPVIFRAMNFLIRRLKSLQRVGCVAVGERRSVVSAVKFLANARRLTRYSWRVSLRKRVRAVASGPLMKGHFIDGGERLSLLYQLFPMRHPRYELGLVLGESLMDLSSTVTLSMSDKGHSNSFQQRHWALSTIDNLHQQNTKRCLCTFLCCHASRTYAFVQVPVKCKQRVTIKIQWLHVYCFVFTSKVTR